MTDARISLLIDGVIALAIIAAATVLLVLDKISAQTSLGLLGVAVVLVGGSAKALLALHVPAPFQAGAAPPAAPATVAPPAQQP